MSKEIEATQVKGVKRMINKLLNHFAKSSLLPGKLRARIHKWRGVQFKNVNSVFFGDNVHIDNIYPHNVFIGNRCIITAGTRILTHFLDTENLSDHEDFHFRFYQGKIVIEDDVFIGFNCVIAKPVTIGRGAIIGANTVITKDVPAGAIMVGAAAINLKKQ